MKKNPLQIHYRINQFHLQEFGIEFFQMIFLEFMIFEFSLFIISSDIFDKDMIGIRNSLNNILNKDLYSIKLYSGFDLFNFGIYLS